MSKPLHPRAKVFVAGHRGLVGSAVLRSLKRRGYDNLLLRTRAELDLGDQSAVARFFDRERPEYVVLAAAKVGGILANSSYPADFIHDNLVVQTNVIRECRRAGVERLLFLGSSCIYPRDCPQPMREEYLLTGPLEATNRPYAIAKIAGIELCWSFNRQYGTSYLAAMPTNLYGPGDNYDPDNSHVIPGLIRRFHDAKAAGAEVVRAWGSGKPMREFLYSDDLAEASVFLLELDAARFASLVAPQTCPLINIGTGSEVSIRELAGLVSGVVGFPGRIEWDASKPDGTPRKLLDVSRLNALGWKAGVRLADGLKQAYADFLENADKSPRTRAAVNH